MCTISAKIILKPRTEKWCCQCETKLYPKEPRLRLYGMAHRGDPPYVLHCHISCAEVCVDDPKIAGALAAYNQSLKQDKTSFAS
jgi:hypothetical protein